MLLVGLITYRSDQISSSSYSVALSMRLEQRLLSRWVSEQSTQPWMDGRYSPENTKNHIYDTTVYK